jgi:hypothetical protein
MDTHEEKYFNSISFYVCFIDYSKNSRICW